MLPDFPATHEARIVTADRGDARRRLDLVLRRHLTDVAAATRTRVQAWIERGCVTVNGALVRRVSARVAPGDILAVAIPDGDRAVRAKPSAENLTLNVVYEDDYLLAVDKPAGMVVHPAYKHATGTVMNALLWRARDWPATCRPSLVSRLDKLTSGIMIVAKTAAAHASLQRAMTRPAFANGFGAAGAEKDYLAVVYGRVNVARGRIELRLAKDRRDRRRVVASTVDGVPSVTRFERLTRVSAPRVGLSLLRCRLVTGRTHQIRVHLAARGWPIVGDSVYGDSRWSRVSDPALAAALRRFPRQALHAWRVAFAHPVTGERLILEAPLPRDFDELLTATSLRSPFGRATAWQAEPFRRRLP